MRLNVFGCYVGCNNYDYFIIKMWNGIGCGVGIVGGYDVGNYYVFWVDVVIIWVNV